MENNSLTTQELQSQFPELYDKSFKQKAKQATISWYKKRLGKITGSRFKDCKFIEKKVALSSKKTDLIEWLTATSERNAVVGEYILKNKLQITTLGDLKNDALKDIVKIAPGVVTMSAGSRTYLEELVAECRLNELLLDNTDGVPRWFSSTSASLEWGIAHEPKAFEMYQEVMDVKASNVGLAFYKDDKIIAASSDAVIHSKYKGVGEIKCPYNFVNHSRIFTPVKTRAKIDGIEHLAYCDAKTYKNYQLKESYYYDERYTAQCLGNMLVHEAEYCDFISFDPRMKNIEDQIAIVRMKREDYADEIAELENNLVMFKEAYLTELDKLGMSVPFYE